MTQDPYRYFRVEAKELLDGLGAGVLELEKGTPGRDLVARMLRLAHTLKGASRVVKQGAIAEMAHAIEDALAPFRESNDRVPKSRIEELFKLVDASTSRLSTLDPQPTAATVGTPRATPEEPLETVRVEIGETDALLESLAEAQVKIGDLRRHLGAADRARRLGAALIDHALPRRGASAAPPSTAAVARIRSIAGELRGALDGLQGDMEAGIDHLQVEMSQARDAANRLRLVPAASVFQPLARAMRDAGHTLGRSVEFRTVGGDMRLDTHVLSALRDALLHVVRNAVAHGIEPEAERTSAGKPAVGTVTLRIERRGSRVAFTCSDDGRGIDVEALREVAVRRGVVPAPDAARLSVDDVVRLTLKGGLSTTRVVTEMSGRGVGLDVVRETAARLRGDVSVRTDRGRGTVVELCVPMSLSSLSALLVQSQGITVAVPLTAICGVVRVADEEITRSARGSSIVFRDAVVPLVPLAACLQARSSAALRSRRLPALVLRSGSRLGAVAVDRLLGTWDLVMRPLPPLTPAVPAVSGACTDADGNPRLVLDPDALVAAACAETIRTDPASVPVRPPVLIVDDSLTTRMLEKSILESAGYEVGIAVSGEEGLVRARERRYGLFLVDVEMPGMTGFDFVAKTRTEPALRDIPAILVTSRCAPEDLRRGEEAGACAYVVKGEFDQGRLLQIIRERIG